MKLLEVLIERKSQSLNRPFSYIYKGNKTVDRGYRVYVPFNNSDLVGYVLNASEVTQSKEELEQKMGFRLEEVFEVLDDKPLLNEELMGLAEKLSSYYLTPMIGVLQAMLPNSLKPAKSSFKGPKIAYDIYVDLIHDNEEGLTPKQIETVRFLRKNGLVLKKECPSISVLEKLQEKRIISFVKIEKRRYQIPEAKKEHEKVLTNDQNHAVDVVLKTDKKVTLLQGVTGSGKTEVYLKLTEKILEQGKNVLMLVPEISLTPVMVEYFERRFSGKIAVLHSDLTAAQKYDEYRKISKGDCRIVVGARSAVFAPLTNIGLIIIDEEQVESYKQDSMPAYHARTVALNRAAFYDAKVLLGSATPSLETKAKAVNGIYEYVELPERINKHELPRTTIIDMTKGSNRSRESYVFSNKLLEELRDVISKNEQAVLLVNRRGYSPNVSCKSCGHLMKCPTCGIALTYHKEDNMLKCHHCGHVEEMPTQCPECGSKYISRLGFGTEKIVDELNRLIPNARVVRLDSDVGEIRNNIAKTLKKFSECQADILVGTQMIAKGHDFPNVTLVGVISADLGLTLPSFRSTERTFELIAQSVGRAGRADKEGRAIIQTYNPNHYAIILGAKQDYESFFIKEMNIRNLQKYPPYVSLCSLEISGKNLDAIEDISSAIAKTIKDLDIKDTHVLGPVTPFISRQNDTYHRVILVKYKNSDKIHLVLNSITDSLKNKSSISFKVNVDPYNY